MRISDWSSDVCSPDLGSDEIPRDDVQKLTTDGYHFGLIGKTADEPFRSPLADQGQPEHDRATSQRGGTEYLAHARGLAGTHVLRGDRRAGECHRDGRQEDRLQDRKSTRLNSSH